MSQTRVPRQPMPEQPAAMRVGNFDEVPLGYDEQTAMREASRCLQCKDPKCVTGCPVAVQIPEFIALVAEGKFSEAARKIRETNVFPAICGRVCPQETQCEELCVLAKRGEPVAVGRLERFVADYERTHGEVEQPTRAAPTGRRVVIVGSGPSGLACAADLARLGHAVTVLELFHMPGGVLRYGIPPFRLPREALDAEIDLVRKLGVEIRPNFVVGRTATVDELLEEYDAAFISMGAGLPSFLKLPGENLLGVSSANEFLTRVNLMQAHRADHDTPVHCGQNVVVIGGGNVAMDAARTARRLGAENVTIVYRRSREEMPARAEETHHAEEEGVKFLLLATPVQFLGDDEQWLIGMRCQRMELGEPDESHRRRPVAVKGSEFDIACDTAITAIGSGAHPLLGDTAPGLDVNERGYVVADPKTGATHRAKVFAGGDIVTGAATVIEAMGAGRRAAQAIHEYMANTPPNHG